MKKAIGLSVSEASKNVFSSGLFDCIEYSIGADFTQEDAFEIWYKKTTQIKNLCKKYNVSMHSYHLPFNGERYGGAFIHAPSSRDADIRQRTLEQTKKLITEIADTGVKYVILHGSLRIPEPERQDRLNYFVEYVQNLCDFCKPYDITVAVETLLECCIGGGGEGTGNRIEEFRYIIEKVNRKNMGICLDNNHFIESQCENFIRELGEYIVTVHFSDYDGTKECHYIPGKGITNWKSVTELLNQKGYNGPWLFEIRFDEIGFPTDEELTELTDTWEKLLDSTDV